MSRYIHPIDALHEFENAFTGPGPNKPELPDNKQLRELRIRLLQEEFDEYLEAESKDDIVGIADALADMTVIIHGTAIRYGIPLDEVFNEVHRSNMSKLMPDGTVLRREDGKILKPPTYSPPDIQRILDRRTLVSDMADQMRANGVVVTDTEITTSK